MPLKNTINKKKILVLVLLKKKKLKMMNTDKDGWSKN